jgi:hypothetical protein
LNDKELNDKELNDKELSDKELNDSKNWMNRIIGKSCDQNEC